MTRTPGASHVDAHHAVGPVRHLEAPQPHVGTGDQKTREGGPLTVKGANHQRPRRGGRSGDRRRGVGSCPHQDGVRGARERGGKSAWLRQGTGRSRSGRGDIKRLGDGRRRRWGWWRYRRHHDLGAVADAVRDGGHDIGGPGRRGQDRCRQRHRDDTPHLCRIADDPLDRPVERVPLLVHQARRKGVRAAKVERQGVGGDVDRVRRCRLAGCNGLIGSRSPRGPRWRAPAPRIG